MRRPSPLVAVAIGVLSAAGGSASAAQLLNNTSFETALTAPPTPNDWQYNGQATHDDTNPHTGSYEAFLDNTTDPSNANVTQQTAFGTVTPLTSYTLSLYTESSFGTGALGQAQLEFLNSSGAVLTTDFLPNFPASTSYVLDTGSFTAPAGSSAAFVLIGAITGAVANTSSVVYVDDVTLTSAAVPEPASLGLMVLGGAGLLVRRRAAR